MHAKQLGYLRIMLIM